MHVRRPAPRRLSNPMRSIFPSTAVRRATILALLAVLALPVAVSAQNGRAVVRGRVTDEAGSSVRAARVTLRRATVGFEQSVESDPDGAFVFEDIVPGTYTIAASADGFAVETRALAVDAGESAEPTLVLHPGAFTEEVAVFASTITGIPETVRRIPGSVDVVDSAMLETSRVFNFSEALRKIAGLNVRDEEGFGLRPNIGIRGLNPTRSTKVLLLEDGIPLTYAPYGDNASYYHPPIERFSTIEVLKGSGQIAYGPTTLGGVVNYLTPDPPPTLSGDISVTGGNKDYFNGQASIGDTIGNTGFFLHYLRKQGEGARESMRFGIHDVFAKAVTTIGDRQTLTFRGNYYGEDSKVPYSGLRQDEFDENPHQNPFINDHFYGDRVGASVSHAVLLGSNAMLSTTVYGQRFKRHWWRQSSNSNERPNDSADPNCGGMENLYTDCGNQGRLREYYFFGVEPRLNASHSLFGIRNELDAGFRYHYEHQDRVQKNGDFPTARDGVVVEDNERKTGAFSGFIQNRFIIGGLTITPGVRVERISYERTNRIAPNPAGGLGVTGSTEVTQVLPGLGLAYNFGEKATVFGGVHRGFAPPRTEDIINNTTGGSVDLDAELSWNYEVGARSLLRPGVRLDATFFRMDYENQVVPASIAGGTGATFTNGGETLHQGFEFTGRVDTGTLVGSPHNVYGRIAYTWLPVAQFEGVRFSNIPGFATTHVDGNRLPYAPSHLVNANIGYSHPVGIDALVEAVRVSEQFSDDLNTFLGSADGQRGAIPAYTVWNLAFSYKAETMPTTFFVTVKNLFDETYIADRSRGLIPGPSRLIQAGVKYRF